MHQSCILSNHRYQSASDCAGEILSSPARLRYSENVARVLNTASTGNKSQYTLIASSAKGLHFTHHWGFKIGSMISPDLLYTNINTYIHQGQGCTHLQMGICIGLSFVSMNNPASVSALTTSRLAWNRFMPCRHTYVSFASTR